MNIVKLDPHINNLEMDVCLDLPVNLLSEIWMSSRIPLISRNYMFPP